MRFLGLRALCVVAFIASCGDNIEPPPDPDQAVVVELETVAPAMVTAGDTINIACTLHENDITTMVPADIKVMDEAKVARVSDSIQARKVGIIEVACSLPARGIVDPTPAMVQIVAGPAANVIAETDLPQAPTLELAPDDNANTISGLSATMIHSGHYIATCQLPGSQS